MKMEIEPLINPQAAGPARANAAIVEAQRGPRDVVPAFVIHTASCEGRVVNFAYSGEEAIQMGQLLLVCGAIALGGSPPVVSPAPPSPLIVNGDIRANRPTGRS